MNIIDAFRQLGSYRAAASLCGTTDKTVKRAVQRQQAGGPWGRRPRLLCKNTDAVMSVIEERVRGTDGRISAKRLLPRARAAGYQGSARTFDGLSLRSNGSGGTSDGCIGPGYPRRASTFRRPSHALLQAALRGELDLVTSDFLLDELQEVLVRRFSFSSGAAGKVRQQLDALAEIAEPKEVPDICRDPDDNLVLAAAIAGGADSIVTGDQDLLDLGSYQGVAIVRPATFLLSACRKSPVLAPSPFAARIAGELHGTRQTEHGAAKA